MKTISKSEAIEQITSQMTGPMELAEFTNRVLALWPSKAKNPQAGIRQAI